MSIFHQITERTSYYLAFSNLSSQLQNHFFLFLFFILFSLPFPFYFSDFVFSIFIHLFTQYITCSPPAWLKKTYSLSIFNFLFQFFLFRCIYYFCSSSLFLCFCPPQFSVSFSLLSYSYFSILKIFMFIFINIAVLFPFHYFFQFFPISSPPNTFMFIEIYII